jgi:hypothetical protein
VTPEWWQEIKAVLEAGWVHQHNRRHEEAIAAFGRCAELTGRCPFALVPLGCALAEVGRIGDARAILDGHEARTRGISASCIGSSGRRITHSRFSNAQCESGIPVSSPSRGFQAWSG